jgi:hypothetical protein
VGETHQLVLIIHKTLLVMKIEIKTSETVCWQEGRTGGQSAAQRNSTIITGVLDIAQCAGSMSSG